MWIETALLYAWIRVGLQGAGSELCLRLEQRNCAGCGKPRALTELGARYPMLTVFSQGRCEAPPGTLGRGGGSEREGSRSNSS